MIVNLQSSEVDKNPIMNINNFIEYLNKLPNKVAQTGSRFFYDIYKVREHSPKHNIVNKDTDWDFFMEYDEKVYDELLDMGFKRLRDDDSAEDDHNKMRPSKAKRYYNEKSDNDYYCWDDTTFEVLELVLQDKSRVQVQILNYNAFEVKEFIINHLKDNLYYFDIPKQYRTSVWRMLLSLNRKDLDKLTSEIIDVKRKTAVKNKSGEWY